MSFPVEMALVTRGALINRSPYTSASPDGATRPQQNERKPVAIQSLSPRP